jgi:chromosome segregation ATPase
MDLVQAFIKEQFNDDDDYYENTARKTKSSKANREVEHLKKELEELKFYQELERTEYEDMKRKMYNMEKKQKTVRSRNVDENGEPVDGDDVFDSISEEEDGANHADLKSKLRQKEEEVRKLEHQLKTDTNAKEFGKRMHKLEKAKNEEIDEIKTHYKGLMEQLAKQIQKANERYDDEVKKNSGLRKTLEDMRQDMASREQELENKLLEMGNVLAQSERRVRELEKKLVSTEENLANTESKLNEALEDRKKHEKKMRNLEEDFEEERKEMIASHNQDKDYLTTEHESIVEGLQQEIDELKKKMNATLEKLDTEERAHEDTVVQLKNTENALKAVRDENVRLEELAKEATNEARLHRIQADNEVKEVKEDRKTQLAQLHDKISQLHGDKMTLATELKSTTAKLLAAEKKVELMGENNTQKQGALRRKTSELEQLQLELRNLADRHLKDVKFKDLQLVRERKKWIATEQALKKEIEDIKMSPAFQRLQLEKSPDVATASLEELKQLVEQLRAEKASLTLQMSAIKERTARDMKNLEKKLKETETRDQVEKNKDEPAFNTGSTRSMSSNLDTFQIRSVSPSKSTSSLYQKLPSSSNMSVATDSSSEVSVGGIAPNRKALSSTAFRRQLRSRKFSNKQTE